jgi:hypothetical protein
MSDSMMKVNLDEILKDSSLPETPELRRVLEQAYNAGAFEAAVAPSAPGDPAAAEREAEQFAVAARLVLDHPNAPGRDALRSVLDAHLARKS